MDASSSVIPVSKLKLEQVILFLKIKKNLLLQILHFINQGSLDINSLPVANTSGYEEF